MTKKWSSTRSLDGQTKREASKNTRRKSSNDIKRWLKDQGAVESVKYDEDTGEPHRVFTICLTKA